MTSRKVRRRRGEPLVALGLILFGWICVRAAFWDAWPGPSEAATSLAAAPTHFAPPGSPPGPRQDAAAPFVWARQRVLTVAAAGLPTPRGSQRESVLASARAPLPPAPLFQPPPPPPSMPAVSPNLAGGHAMLWLAAVTHLPGPEALLAAVDAAPAPVAPLGGIVPRQPAVRGPRWSGDAWVLVRRGGGAPAPAALGGTYGASQAGAILRYRLAPASAHRPTAYVRGTAALNGSGEREVAAGLSLRPLGPLPVVVAAEGRVARIGGGTVVRPAVFAVTELAPVTLPEGTRAEFYVQGGYVGGRGATAFVDGQLRLDKRVAQLGPLELRAGVGAWGGAQKGAERLDVGPSATLSGASGAAAARVAFDWRFRTAGAAAPASGPALTVSAGF